MSRPKSASSTNDGASARRAGVVVIGLGNPLMGDDGLGLVVLDQLRANYEFEGDVELVDGGTWGLNLLPVIEGADHVLLLDAIRVGATPGTLVSLAGDEVPRGLATKLSPHQIDMREILALAQLRGTLPAEIVAIGLEPETVELRKELSPGVNGAVHLVIWRALDQLRAWGVKCRRALAEVP